MSPTMHESTKHPQRGRRTVSIDRFPKINGSGIPDSSPFHKKCVARPQKKFSDRPLFQKGSPGCRAGTLRKASEKGWRTVSIDRFPKINGSGIPDSSPFHKKCVARPQKSFRIDPFFKRGRRGCRAGSPAKIIQKPFTHTFGASSPGPHRSARENYHPRHSQIYGGWFRF